MPLPCLLPGEKFNYYYYGHVKPPDKKGDDIIYSKSVFMLGTEIVRNSTSEDNKIKVEVQLHSLKEEAKDKDEESGVEDDSD